MATSDKVIFKMLANIYLLRKSINTNFTIILMPLSLTLHNYDKFLWYKSYVPSKYIYINIYIYIYILHPLGWSIAQYYTHFSSVGILLFPIFNLGEWHVEIDTSKVKNHPRQLGFSLKFLGFSFSLSFFLFLSLPLSLKILPVSNIVTLTWESKAPRSLLSGKKER